MASDDTDAAASSGVKHRHGIARWAKRVLILVVLLVIAAAILIPSYQGYRPRQLISEALVEGLALRTRVTEIYESRRRLPLESEAVALRIPQSELKRAQSVVWDAAGRRVVVTVGDPQPGKRFAFHAEERDGNLTWACRTIDLEAKYLPASCR